MSQWIDGEEVFPFGEPVPPMSTHKKLSLLKSAIRIFGYALLPWHLYAGVVVLIISEGVGIIEEWGER